MQYSDRISLVGGAATVNAITGMDIDAACFLIPIGIAVCQPFFYFLYFDDWSFTF